MRAQLIDAAPRLAVPENRLAVLFVMSLAHFLVMVDATIVNVALPSIQLGLGFSAADLPWVVNSYSFAFGGCLLLGGWAADLLGPKRVFTAGMVLFGVGSVVCGLAGSAEALIVGRIVQGVGGALVCPAALAAINLTFVAPGERARALAGWSAAGAGALALGPMVGGALTATFTWQSIFLVPVPLCLAAAAAAWWWLPMTRGGRVARRFGRSLGFPFRRVLTANLVLALTSAAMVAACYTCTLWLQGILGYGPMQTGLAFLPLSLGILLGAAIAPALMRRTSTKFVAVLGLAEAAVGMILLARLPVDASMADLLPTLTVLAVGFGLQSVPICALATSVPGDQALAAAVYQTAGQLGGGLGLVALASLIAYDAAELSGVEAQLVGRDIAFAGGAAALIAGLLAILMLLRPARPAPAHSVPEQVDRLASQVRE